MVRNVVPVVSGAVQKFAYLIPRLPGSDAFIIWMKPGDMSVHLAGIAGFLGLGLHRYFMGRAQTISQWKEFALWMIWGMDVIVAGSRNRGGLLAVLTTCFLILLFKPMSRLNRVILPALVILLVGLTFNIEIPIHGGRTVSVHQIVDNIQSVFFKSDKTTLSETTSWRLEWWNRIEDDIFAKDFFWDGRGFGVNLAAVHGFGDATGNRSPHNGHLTILARSGIVGITLWLLLVGTLGYMLIQGYFRMRALGRQTYANINLWLATYGMAFMVNASFDVYLEGPQGGIWFWCIVGYAIALLEEQRLLYSSAVARSRQAYGHLPGGAGRQAQRF